MINSLSNDSHIAPYNCRPRAKFIQNVHSKQNYNIGALVTNQGIIARKPAEVSFCGFSSSLLAHEPEFHSLVKKSRTFLTTTDHKQLVDLINGSVKTVTGENINSPEIKKFVASNKSLIDSVISKTRTILEDENKKDPLSHHEMTKAIRKTIKTSCEVYKTVENPGWFYKSEAVRKFFINADDSHAVFGAMFALLLTCVMRPASIMVMPAKNKDDNKYAAAHSIASGLISYGLSLVISAPIANAMKKLQKEPDKFLKDKELEYLKHTRQLETAKKFMNFGHEMIIAAPRAMITIALIPPILKYVFGWEKKKKDVAPKEDNVAKKYDVPQSDKAKETFSKVAGGEQ